MTAGRVFRPPFWGGVFASFAAFTLFFLGVALFGSQNPGLGGVLAVLFCVSAYASWRRGLYVGADGVTIIRPWKLHDLKVKWDDIARFEMRMSGSLVNLIRASDQSRIPIPIFARPRTDIDPTRNARMAAYHAKVAARVDELNELLETHRTTRA